MRRAWWPRSAHRRPTCVGGSNKNGKTTPNWHVNRKFAIVIAGLAAAMVTALGTGASASPTAPQAAATRLTWAKIFAMSSTQVAALQNPLIAAVAPVHAVGSTMMRSIYWGTALDTPDHIVDLYVTDPGKAAAMIAVAKRQDHGLNTSLFHVMRTAYSFGTLEAAGNRVMAASIAKRLPFPVYLVGQLDRGASLRLQVPDVARARAMSYVPLASLGGRSVAQLAGVQLTFQQGMQVIAANREDDTAPFIGGDFLKGTGSDSNTHCSGGISIENSAGRDFLITANHCYHSGNVVTNNNGTAQVGIPYRYNNYDDAELIDTGKYNGNGAQADEGESNTSGGGINYYKLTNSDPGWSINQQFCQDGAESYKLNHNVPCDLFVQGATDWYVHQLNGNANTAVDGLLAQQPNPNGPDPITGVEGDSGTVVFSYIAPNVRWAAGMLDAIQPDGTTPCTNNNPDGAAECPVTLFVWWGGRIGQAVNLYNAFGFTGVLNPHS